MANSPTALDERQRQLEMKMRGLGIEKYHRLVRQARDKEREGNTQHGTVLLRESIHKVADAIDAWLEEVGTEGRGANVRGAVLLSRVDSEVAALIALSTILDSMMSRVYLTSCAAWIGARLTDELRFGDLKRSRPDLFHWIMRDTAQATTLRHRRNVTVFTANKHRVEWEAPPKEDGLRAGLVLLDIIEHATGFVKRTGLSRPGGKGVTYILNATDELKQWVNNFHGNCEALNPTSLPMLIPPRPWGDTGEGGYHHPEYVGQEFIVKTKFAGHRKRIEQALPQMPVAIRALNALQATPWQINMRLLDVAELCWQQGLAIEGMPSREDLPLPPLPHDIDTNKAALRDWKRAAFPVRDHNARSLGGRLQAVRLLSLAREFADEAEINFPHQIDFRGRAYAMVANLNPQGSSLAKGLLQFAEPMALNTWKAAGWLAIHGANCLGRDDLPLQERIGVIEAMNAEIDAIACDPMNNKSWMEADSPWQFLAFCFEWCEFRTVGLSFESHLPVAMDATCSGLQHFSAMTRDLEGGATVNLTAGDQKADIYQRVCDRMLELMREDLGSSDLAGVTKDRAPITYGDLAHCWLSLEPDRSATKRQVMVLPYGGTDQAIRDYTRLWLTEKCGLNEPLLFKLTEYGKRHMKQAMDDTITGARDVMAWLQQCADVAGTVDHPISWQVPTGFVVHQFYTHARTKQVRTVLRDKIIRVRVQIADDTEKKRLNTRKMRNSISPNFVHALDAAHMALALDLALDNRISHFHCIHDSFGTHAANTELFAAVIREAFIDMYEDNDVLRQFQKDLRKHCGKEIPSPPPRGKLDLSSVRDSQFFFS